MHSAFLLFCSSILTPKLEESVLSDLIHLIQATASLAQQRPITHLIQRRKCSKVVVALAQDPMQNFHRDRMICPESPGRAAKGLVYVTVSVINRPEPHLYRLEHIPHGQKIQVDHDISILILLQAIIQLEEKDGGRQFSHSSVSLFSLCTDSTMKVSSEAWSSAMVNSQSFLWPHDAEGRSKERRWYDRADP